MESAGFLSVKNFERFQHYKDRSPPWIKLYNDLLGDYEFGRLQDASKLHLILIWLLASRHQNRVPADPEWIARQISATERVHLDELVNAGFITMSQDASMTLALARAPSARGEREKEKETTLAQNEFEPAVDLFERLWQDRPRREGSDPKKLARNAWNARCREGIDPPTMLEAHARYKNWCEMKRKIGTETVMRAATFLGDPEHFANPWSTSKPGVNGQKPAGTKTQRQLLFGED